MFCDPSGKFFKKIANFVGGAVGGVTDFVGDVFDGAANFIGDVIEGAACVINDAINGVANVINDHIINPIGNAISGAADWLNENIVKPVGNWYERQPDWLKATIGVAALAGMVALTVASGGAAAPLLISYAANVVVDVVMGGLMAVIASGGDWSQFGAGALGAVGNAMAFGAVGVVGKGTKAVKAANAFKTTNKVSPKHVPVPSAQTAVPTAAATTPSATSAVTSSRSTVTVTVGTADPSVFRIFQSKGRSHNTIRKNYWKNQANTPGSEWHGDKDALMGLAPIGPDGKKMVLHHPLGREGDNLFILQELTFTNHVAFHGKQGYHFYDGMWNLKKRV